MAEGIQSRSFIGAGLGTQKSLNATDCTPVTNKAYCFTLRKFEKKTYLAIINNKIFHKCLKHRGQVDLGELVPGENKQQACLSAGTVSDNHQLSSDRSHAAEEHNINGGLLLLDCIDHYSEYINVNFCIGRSSLT